MNSHPIILSSLLAASAISHAATTMVAVNLGDGADESIFNVTGPYYATIDYNIDALSTSERTTLRIGMGLNSLKFDFDGTVYDSSADIATGYPRVTFEEGVLASVDFWNSEGLEGRPDGSYFRFLTDKSFNYSLDGVEESFASYQVVNVPEPSIIGALSSALIIIFLKRNRI